MRTGLHVAVVFVVSCGSGTATQPVAISTPVPDAGATSVADERVASDALAKAWPIDQPEILFYADISAALSPDLVLAKLLPSLGALTSKATPAAQMTCVHDALLASKEIAMGAQNGTLFIARYDPARAPGFRPCFGVSVDTATVRGADDAWMAVDGNDVVAISRDLFLMGKKELVESAIERRGTSSGALRRLGLTGNEIARFHIESQAVLDATVSATRARLSASCAIETHSASDAEHLAKQANHLASQIPAVADLSTAPSEVRDAEHDALVRLAGALHATHHGKHVDVAFSLDEPAADQSRDLGAAFAFVKRSIDEYLIASKQAEARATITAIAKDIAVWWEREELPASRKTKLISFPPVPDTVPRGVKVMTKSEDWKAWAPLHFEMDMAQYYQYEVRAAKDGRSASIIARGDLDGDGKTSLFEHKMKVGPGRSLEFDPTVIETNPSE